MKGKYIYILFLSLFVNISTNAQSKTECDSIIERGHKAAYVEKYSKALELFNQVYFIAQKNKWYLHECKSLTSIGVVYAEMQEYGTAYKYYIKAYTIANKKLTYKEQAVILNNIGILYESEHKYAEAKEYFSKAYEITKNKNFGLSRSILINLGNSALNLKNPNSAKKYIKESLPYLKDNLRDSIWAHMILAEGGLLEKNSKFAREKSNELLNRLKNNIEYKDIINRLQFIVCQSYFNEANYNEAIINANKILSLKPNDMAKEQIFDLLTKAYKKLGVYDIALEYKDSVFAIQERLNEKKNAKLFESSKVKFDVERYKHQTEIHQQKLVSERKIFYALLIIAIATIIIIILFFRQRHQRSKHKAILELEQEKNIKLALEQQITNALLEQELLKNEVENRDKKIYSKELFLSDRNHLIEEITASLLKNDTLLKDRTLTDNIKALKSHLKTDGEWENFIVHFEKVNNGFLSRLKELHQTLNQNDIKFIAYIYMNLSVKEIATVLNITLGASKKRKERIAAKMNIPEDMSIYDYISSI